MIKRFGALLGILVLAAANVGSLKAATESPQQPVCVLVQGPVWGEGKLNRFLAGIRKAFEKKTLPVSAFDGHGHWYPAGEIHNAFRLVSQCPSSKIVDSLGYHCVDAKDYGKPVNCVWISLSLMGEFADPGGHYTGLGVDVALCAPESLTSVLPPIPGQHATLRHPAWPSTKHPGMESQGKLVGLAALEAVHQRLQLLPASSTLLRNGE